MLSNDSNPQRKRAPFNRRHRSAALDVKEQSPPIAVDNATNELEQWRPLLYSLTKWLFVLVAIIGLTLTFQPYVLALVSQDMANEWLAKYGKYQFYVIAIALSVLVKIISLLARK